MRALVVYESMFGNTALLARAIAEGLGPTVDVDLLDTCAAPSTTDGYDFVVAGGPTHALSMSRPKTRQAAIEQGGRAGAVGLREWLDGLPEGHAEQAVATFDTRMNKARTLPGSAAKSAARIVRHKDYISLAPPASFYVHDTEGPLMAGELERASVWGSRLSALAITRRSQARRRLRVPLRWWSRSA